MAERILQQNHGYTIDGIQSRSRLVNLQRQERVQQFKQRSQRRHRYHIGFILSASLLFVAVIVWTVAAAWPTAQPPSQPTQTSTSDPTAIRQAISEGDSGTVQTPEEVASSSPPNPIQGPATNSTAQSQLQGSPPASSAEPQQPNPANNGNQPSLLDNISNLILP